jgi:hypothetical protein
MKHRLFPFLSLILVLIACELPVFYASPAPTPIPGLIGTSVAQTVVAARTQTALILPPPTHTPTMTLLPTNTSTETPSPTATIIFIIPTSTFTRTATPLPTSTEVEFSDENWACRLISKNPVDNQALTPRADFDARWVVENTGKKSWSSSDVDYIYYSGTKMHKKEAYDLTDTVDRGESTTIIVDMIAPKNAGTYSTTWTLRSGQNEFCRLHMSIVVK